MKIHPGGFSNDVLASNTVFRSVPSSQMAMVKQRLPKNGQSMDIIVFLYSFWLLGHMENERYPAKDMH